MEVEQDDEPRKKPPKGSPTNPRASAAQGAAAQPEEALLFEEEKKRAVDGEGIKSQRSGEEEAKTRKHGGENSSQPGAHKRHTSQNSQGY